MNNVGPNRPIQFVSGHSEKVNVVAGILPARRNAAGDIVDNPENTDHRGRVNGHISGLVVERDVTAGHRNSKLKAAIGQSSRCLLELPHNLWVLRAAEVQAVSDGKRLCSANGNISVGLGKSQARTLVWVELAEATVGIGRNRNT